MIATDLELNISLARMKKKLSNEDKWILNMKQYQNWSQPGPLCLDSLLILANVGFTKTINSIVAKP